MNIQKVKMALSIGLTNPSNQHPLRLVQELLDNLQEVGQFLGEQFLGTSPLSRGLHSVRYALRYENCTIDLELVEDATKRQSVVRGFRLR